MKVNNTHEDFKRAKQSISKIMNDLQEKYPEKSFNLHLNADELMNAAGKSVAKRIEVELEAKEVV